MLELLFLNSWWLPQIGAMLTISTIVIVPTYLITKFLRVQAKNKKMPDNIMFALVKEGAHTIAYIHKDANIAAPDVANAIAAQQLEHKELEPPIDA